MAAVPGPWWLIGGVAIALHGIGTEHLADIDVIMGAADARSFLDSVGAGPGQPKASDRFRSQVFGRWLDMPVSVDVMGGLEVFSADAWTPVTPQTREPVVIAGKTLFAPSRQELISILHLFGRPKDLARADALSRLKD